ncbi:zinc-dependent metalloprotease [Bifidobacterium amazonense]|uniref:Zinc-dependent metalloprotease n=1 Tax=Bifidobacterium amazonense TaxID=2809027 RepID=A0ABS9VSN4_9BIFI|nr:zinc-dependent metalloprotease [Bifidobacterium amazonense]MCH9274924.1 zinc-dependent metalloprotease [Bifidobacterium amazonense]
MDDNAIHQWLIECFGPIQGEMAYKQLENLPEPIREQLMSQDPSKLPKPSEVQSLMQAFTAGGLNSVSDMQQTVAAGPINVKLAKSIALQQANGEGSQSTVSAVIGEAARRAMSEANLWLDTACEMDPASGEPQVLTRAGWVEGTIDAWAKFAAPVAESMNNALASVISERLGDAFNGEISGMFAGPVPIPIPDGMKDPAQLIKLLGNTSFAMQLGQAAGKLSHEVHGSFDQGIALLSNPAGGLIAQNVEEYAKSLDIPTDEVMSFLALREMAHARLFASVPWLMPRFEALIGKYARGVDIDLDAMEEQLREATAMDPEAISGAVNLTKVGIADTPEQKEALASLETMLALVEGWVDCVTWRAGMAHIPHIEQLREMMRRERAIGGPAERTFESLLGLELRPKRMREAAAVWERLGAAEGPEARDAKWSHPDLLPALPDDDAAKSGPMTAASGTSGTSGDTSAGSGAGTPAAAGEGTAADSDDASAHPAGAAPSEASSSASGASPTGGIDWDAELTKLLEEDAGDDGSDGTPDGSSPSDN